MPKKQVLTDELAGNYITALTDLLRKHNINIKYPFSNRFFRTIKEENGQIVNNPIASPDSVASKADQNAFFQSIMDGNAYFYPMDSNQPVRLTFQDNPDRKPRFVLQETPVDLTPPKKPGFFKQIFHKLFGAFKEDFSNYNKAVMTRDYLENTAPTIRDQEIGVGEKKQYTDHVEAKNLEETADSMQMHSNWLSGCMTRLDATMGPTFRQTEDLLEQKVYKPDFKLPDYKKPEGFTERECSLVALSVFTDPKVGGLEVDQNTAAPEHRVHGNYAFVMEGFFAAYRAGIGERGYTSGLEQARLLGAEAMEKFNQGDPKELAHYIGLAIRENNINIIPKQGLSETIASYAKINTELLDMLYKYPKLRESAMENGYLNSKDLQRAELGRGVVKLYQDYADSKLKLARAAQEGRDLSEDEKSICIANITAYTKMSSEFGSNYKNCPEKIAAENSAKELYYKALQEETTAAAEEGRAPDLHKPEIMDAFSLLDEAIIFSIQPSAAMKKLSDIREVQKMQSDLKEHQVIRDTAKKSTKELSNSLNNVNAGGNASAFICGIINDLKNAIHPVQPTIQEPQNVPQPAPQRTAPVNNGPQDIKLP